MTDALEGVRVAITAYVDNDPPGIVGCEFADVHGRVWQFAIKFYDVSDEDLGEDSAYPLPGVLGCDMVVRVKDEAGRDVAVVDTNWPSLEGEERFVVFADQLTEAVTVCFVQRMGGTLIPLIPKKT